MTTTNFPNGITSFGIPIYGGGGSIAAGAPGVSLGVTSIIGNTWFVDTVFGSDGGEGNSPQAALSTMAAVFARLKSGDVINFRGKITENLTTPAQVFDVTINGLGNRPRHADATPLGGQYAAAQWAPAAAPVAGAPTLSVIQQGWRLQNFLMTASGATAPCLQVSRNAGAGNLERDGSHLEVLGMRFAGAGIGIRSGEAGVFTEIPYNVLVAGTQFDGMTFAMATAAGLTANQWIIRDNFFMGNTNQIIMALANSLILRNQIGPFTAAGNSGGIDLNGGAGLNQDNGNWLSGTYSIAGGYRVANANDNWYGNFASVGVTTADPA
jgi:hypothetical protein